MLEQLDLEDLDLPGQKVCNIIITVCSYTVCEKNSNDTEKVLLCN